MRFLRQVIVQVGQPGQRGISISGLRVSFEVERSLRSEPNKATIAIYNPAPATIKAFQESGAVVRLFAGYDQPEQVFLGDVDEARRISQGVDRVLRVEAQDGGRRYRDAYMTQEFPPGTTARQVADAAIEALGIPPGVIRGVPDVTYPEGLALSGRPADVLTALLRQGGVSWSVQEGEVVILGDTDDTGETAPLITPETGLIGSPEAGPDGLACVCLLTPQIRPGRRFRLKSREYDGLYRAEKVRHAGDSGFDSAFHTYVDAVEAT